MEYGTEHAVSTLISYPLLYDFYLEKVKNQKYIYRKGFKTIWKVAVGAESHYCTAEHAVSALISSQLVANVHFPVHDDGLCIFNIISGSLPSL